MKSKLKKPKIKDYEIGRYIMSTPNGTIVDYVARNKKTGIVIRSTESRTKKTCQQKLRKTVNQWKEKW